MYPILQKLRRGKLSYQEPKKGNCGMLLDRRRFIERLGIVSGGAALLHQAYHAQAAPPPQDNLLSAMKWMNEPASAKITGEQIVVSSRAKTDFWQKTFDGFVADNGHFF